MIDIKRKVLTDVIGNFKANPAIAKSLNKHEIKPCNPNRFGLDSLITIRDIQTNETKLVYALPTGKGYATTVSAQDDTKVLVITKETPIYGAINGAFEDGEVEFRANGVKYEIMNHC